MAGLIWLVVKQVLEACSVQNTDVFLLDGYETRLLEVGKSPANGFQL